MRRLDARWQMHDTGRWGRTRMSVATADYLLLLRVARAAERFRAWDYEGTWGYAGTLSDALDALNKPRKQK